MQGREREDRKDKNYMCRAMDTPEKKAAKKSRITNNGRGSAHIYMFFSVFFLLPLPRSSLWPEQFSWHWNHRSPWKDWWF